MDRPVHSVRARLDDFLAELATLHYRYGAGLSPHLPLQALHDSFPELSAPDTFAAATEALEKARAKKDVLAVRRLGLVRELVASQVEEALAAPDTEAIATLEAQARLPVDDQTLSLHDVLEELPHETQRARRALLERAVGNFLWSERGRYGARREAALRTAERLGASSYPQLREEVSGIAHGKLVEAAGTVLASTEDAYRDVLGYVLRKVEPALRSLPGGEARRHDLQAALLAPWMDGLFRREDLLPAVTSWLNEWNLPPAAGGHIRVDDASRPGKSRHPFVAAVRVPEEIYLVVPEEPGLDSLRALLRETGRAQYLAHISDTAPMELQRLGDGSVEQAYAALTERLLLCPGWTKRYMGLPMPVARDTARLAAFQALTVLRQQCARLSYELSLSTRGASEERAEEYAAGQRRALFVEPHQGFFLHDVEGQLASARSLRGWALETRLTARLVERFNEDFWRNPPASAWLTGLFSRGGTDDAEALCTELSGAQLSLPEAGARLVAILNG